MSIRKTLILAAFPVLCATAGFAPSATAATPVEQTGETPELRHGRMCGERHAHEIARLAYLEAKLELTDKQRIAWHKWQQWQLDASEKEQADCLSVPPPTDAPPSALDHEARIRKTLAIKLQSLQSSRQALEALYEVLTPAQRATLDRPHGEHFGPPPENSGPRPDAPPLAR